MRIGKRLEQRRNLRIARKHESALAEMKASAASLAECVCALIPAAHTVTAEQIEKAASDLGADFIANAKITWRKDGISDEVIGAMAPMIGRVFTTEFKARLRDALPLHNLSIEGSA